jgi:hypothetical protein
MAMARASTCLSYSTSLVILFHLHSLQLDTKWKEIVKALLALKAAAKETEIMFRLSGSVGGEH